MGSNKGTISNHFELECALIDSVLKYCMFNVTVY